MAYNLKISDERGKQLQMIAEREGKTVADVVTDHIHAKIAAGVIPAELPGVDVVKTASTISIRTKDFEAEIPTDQGPTVAELLRGAAVLGGDDRERKRRWIEGAAALSGLTIKGMGAGVRVASPITGKTYPLTISLASDLADQIDDATK